MQTSEPLGDLLPKMVVEPPGPRSMEMAKRLAKYETPAASAISRGDIPVLWEKAQGSNIVDAEGNRYVDVTGAFFVTAVGYGNPRVVEAIQEQSVLLLRSMGGVNQNASRVELVEKLAAIAPGEIEVSFISNTGSEAVDMALKTARLYSGKSTVIDFQGGFHESIRLVNQTLRCGIMATLRGGEYGNCIRMAPSLTIKKEQLEYAIQVLDESLTVVEEGE